MRRDNNPGIGNGIPNIFSKEVKIPQTGADVILSGEVNEGCLELNLRNPDGRYENLLTMRLYFLCLFHNNTTKSDHSCD